MYFEEKNKIAFYGVDFINKRAISEIILESINDLDISIIKVKSNSMNNKTALIRTPESLYVEQNKVGTYGNVTSCKVSSQTPFTIAFTANCLSDEIKSKLNRFQLLYLSEIQNCEYSQDLSNLLNSVPSIEVLGDIIDNLSNSPKLLEDFLHFYHKDLDFFMRILPYIQLIKYDEMEINILKDKLSKLDTLLKNVKENPTIVSSFDSRVMYSKVINEFSNIKNSLNTASTNSIIEKKLKLNFKKIK